jgi:outer membrane protein TolC
VLLLSGLFCRAAFGAESTNTQYLSLRECVELALARNPDLQIERVNPLIARATLSGSYGVYDPIFLNDARRENAADSGGFDPADFSRDAVYEAESEVVRSGLTGLLPSGLSYALTGSYAHSHGLRNTLNFDSYNLVTAISVRQPLLRNFWTDQPRTLIRINKKNLKITELGVVYMAMDVVNRVHQAYYGLLLAIEDQRVREDLLAARKSFLAATRRRIELGTLTALDEKLAQAQVAGVESELSAARNSVVLAENALKLAIGGLGTNEWAGRIVPTETLQPLPEALTLSESFQRGLEKRPDLAQLRQDIEKSDLDLRFRRNQLFPFLDVVAGYGRKGADVQQVFPPIEPSGSFSSAYDQVKDGTAANDMIGLIFSMPLARTTERANYRASKHLKTQALLRLKQREEIVMREIADAFHLAQNNLERVSVSRRAREFAAAALEDEERKLVGGKSTLFFVLQLQADFARSRSAELVVKADYSRALAQLHFAEGSILEKLGIVLEGE